MRNLHQIIKHLITLAYIWKTKQQVLKKKKKKHIRCTFFFYSYDERVLAKDNQRDTTANL